MIEWQMMTAGNGKVYRHEIVGYIIRSNLSPADVASWPARRRLVWLRTALRHTLNPEPVSKELPP